MCTLKRLSPCLQLLQKPPLRLPCALSLSLTGGTTSAHILTLFYILAPFCSVTLFQLQRSHHLKATAYTTFSICEILSRLLSAACKSRGFCQIPSHSPSERGSTGTVR